MRDKNSNEIRDWRKFLAKNYKEIEEKAKDNSDYKEFLAFAYFMGEVDNGGINQFLYNNSGDFFYDLKSFAEKADCQELKKILHKVQIAFPNEHISQLRDERIDDLDQLDESSDNGDYFEELTDYFYEEQENIEETVNKFLSRYSFLE